MTSALRSFLPAIVVAQLLTGTAFAQTPDPAAPPAADVAVLRDEVARLRDEVAALRAALTEIRAAAGMPSAAPQAAPTQTPAVTREAFDMLRAQVAEQAQTKVESSSRLPVKLSGTILVNAFVNSADVNWLENPNIVTQSPLGADPTGSMSVTARQSRLGIEASGIMMGSWQASGTFITDFLGGVPNFQTGTVMGLPRLLYAFGRIDNGRTAIQAGQDHALLAPRDPTSLAALSFPLFFRSGNLYLRVPQARIEQRAGDLWTFAGGIVAPIAGDHGGQFEFAPAAGIGERSRRPAYEGRAEFHAGESGADRRLIAGLATQYGWRESSSDLTSSWALAVDVDARAGRFGAAGEFFIADRAGAFGAALSQAARTTGGWAEGRFLITSRARVAAGFGMDRPDTTRSKPALTENRSTFGNLIFDLTPEVSFSVEHRWLRTSYTVLPVRSTQHVNGTLAIRF
jgi:hypothetical protein